MVQEFSQVTKVLEVARNTFLLEFVSPEIARSAAPGQFVNIKIDRSFSPLLRRPMSISDVEDNTVKILFNIVGRGTAILARTNPGETIDVIGPLGHGFSLTEDIDLAILVGGGLGAAPFPFLTRELSRRNATTLSFVGTRTASQLALGGLQNVAVATDDGSKGYRGTVVDLLRARLGEMRARNARIFTCGPTPMLRALQHLVREIQIPCEASLETPMACGIGLCQGCPVEVTDSSRRYKLSCKDGPVFDITRIVI